MSRVSKKLIKLGTGSDEVSASDISANFGAPSNYTPGSTDVTGHLTGIDTALGSVLTAESGDINHTSFSLANNQVTPTNITGLSFANGTVRAATVDYSIEIDATANLYEKGVLELIQKDTNWDMSRDFTGDTTLINITVTTAGQLQYTSSSYAGFSSASIKFRAITTNV